MSTAYSRSSDAAQSREGFGNGDPVHGERCADAESVGEQSAREGADEHQQVDEEFVVVDTTNGKGTLADGDAMRVRRSRTPHA